MGKSSVDAEILDKLFIGVSPQVLLIVKEDSNFPV